MIQFNVFPNGKKRVVTFSYDDGHENDVRLVELFNRYGVKATFHLNGATYLNATAAEREKIRTLYQGHEIACHTMQHGWLTNMPEISVVNEVIEDRKVLEQIAHAPVVGMSYPSGAYDERVKAILASCGICYSRTVCDTHDFDLPGDFLAWHPTCHHKDALDLADTFMAELDSQWRKPLFYIWGHSHELRTEQGWAYMESLLEKIAGENRIWYATNLEIYDYLCAVRQLRISADEMVLENPTAMDVWVEKDKKEIIKIPAGKRILL